MREIIVNPNNWVQNVKTGAIKQAKLLTDKERKAQEWRIINRQERRNLKRRSK